MWYIGVIVSISQSRSLYMVYLLWLYRNMAEKRPLSI